jgi:transcription antitermination factor NusG
MRHATCERLLHFSGVGSEPFPRNGSRKRRATNDVHDKPSCTKGGEALMNAESWYAIWTRSHCERLVEQQLTARGFSPFLPEVAAPLRSARRAPRNQGKVSMFPGYLFVRDAMTKERYVEMLGMRGIVRVLEDGWTRLTPVPESDIDAIRHIVESGVAVFPHPLLQHGDRVRVADGPLSGIHGIFVTDSQQKGRLVVTIDLLGRSVALEVSGEDVVRCN